jgi:hypothetical protein
MDDTFLQISISDFSLPKIAGRVSRKPQELTHLASAFKTQAESELSENRPEPGRLSSERTSILCAGTDERMAIMSKKKRCHEPSPILGNLAISLENGMI